MKYRWLKNGEQMAEGDEYATTNRKGHHHLPEEPNDDEAAWQPIPDANVGKIYYDFQFKGTRRLITHGQEG